MNFQPPDISKDRKDIDLLSQEALAELAWQQQQVISCPDKSAIELRSAARSKNFLLFLLFILSSSLFLPED